MIFFYAKTAAPAPTAPRLGQIQLQIHSCCQTTRILSAPTRSSVQSPREDNPSTPFRPPAIPSAQPGALQGSHLVSSASGRPPGSSPREAAPASSCTSAPGSWTSLSPASGCRDTRGEQRWPEADPSCHKPDPFPSSPPPGEAREAAPNGAGTKRKQAGTLTRPLQHVPLGFHRRRWEKLALVLKNSECTTERNRLGADGILQSSLARGPWDLTVTVPGCSS